VRADIVNLSLGSDFYSEAEQAALNEVRAAGVFLVASAGNDASTVPSYPASYDGVVSVSASTITGDLATYSNFGPLIDVAAPGGDFANAILSTLGQGESPDIQVGYNYLTGTSMAAPHVSGVIALMKAVNPGLTPAQFDALLQSGDLTVDAGAAGRDDQFGWGIIDATRAVQAAIDAAGGSLGAVLSVSTGTLNFQAFTQSLLFSVGNLGDEPVSVSVSDDAPWLGVTPVDVDADGLGQYQVTIDRSGLADGNYAGTVTITPDDPAVSARSVSVAMRVTSADVNADAGQHYVILVPPDAEESAVAIGVNAVDGQYTFQLTDVAPGDYRLFAGTDHDDDNFICDGGEACGAFPSLSSPAVLRIDAREQPSVTDQSFSSEFRTTVTTTSAGADAGATGVPGLKLNRPERPQP
jgi:serine protease